MEQRLGCSLQQVWWKFEATGTDLWSLDCCLRVRLKRKNGCRACSTDCTAIRTAAVSFHYVSLNFFLGRPTRRWDIILTHYDRLVQTIVTLLTHSRLRALSRRNKTKTWMWTMSSVSHDQTNIVTTLLFSSADTCSMFQSLTASNTKFCVSYVTGSNISPEPLLQTVEIITVAIVMNPVRY